MRRSDVVFVSQWPPLNRHGQYTIDPLLPASPTGSKDGMTIRGLKGGIFVPAPCWLLTVLPCSIWDALTLSPPRGIQARKSCDSFPIFKHKNILLGKSPLPNVPAYADTNSIRACPKDWFCHLYSWQMALYFTCTHWGQQDLKQSMQILILNPGPESPTPPKFYIFQKCWSMF